jgi:hypothetical protein
MMVDDSVGPASITRINIHATLGSGVYSDVCQMRHEHQRRINLIGMGGIRSIRITQKSAAKFMRIAGEGWLAR